MYQGKDFTETRDIRRGEIYYIDLSNIDYVDTHIAGKIRPGLIVQNNVGNANSPNVIVALLTTSEKKPYPFQYKINFNGRTSSIMFDQLLTISKENLNGKIIELSPKQIYDSDKALMCSLDLLPYSMSSIKDFNIVSIQTKRNRLGEKTNCIIDIFFSIMNNESKSSCYISMQDLTKFDSSITKDSDLDEIKDKLNNCTGLNFLMNHLQF